MSVVVAKNLQQGEASAAPVPANASNHGHLPIKGLRLFLVAADVTTGFMVDNQPFAWADVGNDRIPRVVAKNLQQGEASAAPVPANASNHGHLPIKGADGVLITVKRGKLHAVKFALDVLRRDFCQLAAAA
jgi:hypothetical protein